MPRRDRKTRFGQEMHHLLEEIKPFIADQVVDEVEESDQILAIAHIQVLGLVGRELAAIADALEKKGK